MVAVDNDRQGVDFITVNLYIETHQFRRFKALEVVL